jgi:AraC-like DNA-binding protein
MEIIRDPGIISGFRFEHPLPDLPALTHCGEAFAGQSHIVSAQTHPSYEFHYMVQGTIHWKINGLVHAHSDGNLSWTPPELEHESVASYHAEHHILWIGLRLDRLGGEGDRLARSLRGLAAQNVFVFPAVREIELLLRCLILQITDQREFMSDACRQYVQTFLLLVLQSIAARASGVTLRDVRPFSYPVVKSLQYMKDHLDERIPLETLAQISGLGKSQLTAHFLHEVGQPPSAYHLQRRLEAAREVLVNPEMSITQVALEFGFSSSQHFARAFTQAFGMTPMGWQRSRQEIAKQGRTKPNADLPL